MSDLGVWVLEGLLGGVQTLGGGVVGLVLGVARVLRYFSFRDSLRMNESQQRSKDPKLHHVDGNLGVGSAGDAYQRPQPPQQQPNPTHSPSKSELQSYQNLQPRRRPQPPQAAAAATSNYDMDLLGTKYCCKVEHCPNPLISAD